VNRPIATSKRLVVGGVLLAIALLAVLYFALTHGSKSAPSSAAPPSAATSAATTTVASVAGKGSGPLITVQELPPATSIGERQTSQTVQTRPLSTAPSSVAPGSIAYGDLPTQAQHTIQLIQAGGPYPYSRDGVVFENRAGTLPRHKSGYYHEFTVVTPKASTRGTRRIITGQQGEMYYTDDHYATFRLVVMP
jgi:ribonuclease T1